ncbi:MAG: hypothetical protein ACUVWJ_00485 [Spirochaetota bacterium]
MIAHDVFTAICTRSLGAKNRSIPITPFRYFDDTPSNPSLIIEFREGGRPTVTSEDPNLDENEYYPDNTSYSRPEGGKVPWVEVLSLYSAEPDWGMDDGLRLSPIQGLMGGSQGYRHMLYNLFCFKAGVPHRRAIHFHSLARVAFIRGDTYWGVRFSARAIHYIQDILSPFHTKPFPEWYILRKLLSPVGLYYTTYNYHLNFERLTGYYLWHGEPGIIRCIEDAPVYPFDGLKNEALLEKEILKASRKAKKLFFPIFRECARLWAGSMGKGYYKIKREEIEKLELPQKLLELACMWLGSSASFIKGYIRAYVLPFVDKGG